MQIKKNYFKICHWYTTYHRCAIVIMYQISHLYFFAAFIYTTSSQLYDIKTALRYHDTFINCSVLSTTNEQVIWKYRNVLVNISNTDKYTKNGSGLIIHNVTNDDEGQYVCSIVQPILKAYITVNVNCKISYAVYWICI